MNNNQCIGVDEWLSGTRGAGGQRRWVICFGPGDYHAFTPSCTTHIMNEFWKRGFGVLWINPIPIGVPSVRNTGGRKRILLRMRSYLRPLRRVRERFYTFSPIPIPVPGGSRQSGLKEDLLRGQLRLIARMLGVRDALVWAETPTARYGMHIFNGPKIYQLSDKYELSRYASTETAKKLAEYSHALVREADLVLCTARTLWRELCELRPDVHYLPHAIDLELFSTKTDPPPIDIANLPHPIIGYFGTLSSSNNQLLLSACAERHPEWSIVLIGRITGGDWSLLESHSNVHFLGFKPLDEIPRYGQCFDVGVMDWTLDEWMHYVHPLKLREYLALGLPVVSVPIPEVVESYGDMVHVADGPEQFVRKVEQALAENTADQAAHRRAWVAQHTWHSYVETVLQSLSVQLPRHSMLLPATC